MGVEITNKFVILNLFQDLRNRKRSEIQLGIPDQVRNDKVKKCIPNY